MAIDRIPSEADLLLAEAVVDREVDEGATIEEALKLHPDSARLLLRPNTDDRAR